MNEEIIIRKCKSKICDIKNIESNQYDDYYIACIGYEPRTTEIIRKLDKNYRAEYGLFFINKGLTTYKKMEKYIKIINKIIAKKKYFTIKEEINISINDPLKLIIKLNEKFQQINKTKT